MKKIEDTIDLLLQISSVLASTRTESQFDTAIKIITEFKEHLFYFLF